MKVVIWQKCEMHVQVVHHMDLNAHFWSFLEIFL